MENPLISIVISVYNTGKYLEKAVDCLLKQSYENFELIIINDGSNDGSDKLCEQQVKRDNRIRVVHKDNGGLSSARNRGITEAKGERIIFPDPDDWTDSNYIQLLVDLHNEYHTDLEISGFYINTKDKEIVKDTKTSKTLLTRTEALRMLMKQEHFIGSACNKMYHMDIIKKNDLLFDEELGMAQDLHFAYRYFCCCKSIIYDPTPTYHYYQEAGGVTSLNTPLTERKLSGLKTYERIAELSHEIHPYVYSAARSTLFNLSMNFMYIYFSSRMHDKALLNKLRLNLRNNKEYFFSNSSYSTFHKTLGRIALINPRTYYFVKYMYSRVF